ncbi:hypothetical protein SOV_38930 [Sporomusa ovata DSM 2662]|nr:hypothetical protein SOV_3c01550 [Sporomusa ovata DSM 2662]
MILSKRAIMMFEHKEIVRLARIVNNGMDWKVYHESRNHHLTHLRIRVYPKSILIGKVIMK